MAKLVILVTAQIEEGHRVGEAWQAAGSPGVTLIEGHGLRQLQEAWRNADVLPGTISLTGILRDNDVTSLIAFSLVDDDALVDKLIDATEAVLGDLTAPDTGVLLVLDVFKAIGLQNYNR